MSREPDPERRTLLAGGVGLALGGLLGCGDSSAPSADAQGLPGSSATPTTPPHFLTAAEYRALDALVDRLIPPDTDPGARAAGCADAIDHLLGALQSSPAFIHAGAPYSDRAGHPVNQFAQFIALDDYEELAWRITLEGSQGKPEREFNGAVTGWQQTYRAGLARLDVLAQQQGAADFASLSILQQDLTLLTTGDGLVQALLDIAFPHTLEAMYGAPEYGGNRNLAGWGFTAFDGDVQPRGYTDDQVVNCDEPQLTDALLPPSYHDPAQRQQTLAARLRRTLFATRHV